MFCNKCGTSIEPRDRFCQVCGSPPASIVVAPKKGLTISRFFVYGSVVFVALMMVRLMINLIVGPEASAPAKSGLAESAQPSEVRHKVGEHVFAGYWAYRCESAKWQDSFPIDGGYLRRVANAKFLVVDLSFRNNDTSSSMLPPAKLLDDEGREYEISPELSVTLTSLNPGVTGRGDLVFDVPPGKYFLKLAGGFTSGESVQIDLPVPTK
jgi:uncharacterized protein DUF4352/zinc ribbon protein